MTLNRTCWAMVALAGWALCLGCGENSPPPPADQPPAAPSATAGSQSSGTPPAETSGQTSEPSELQPGEHGQASGSAVVPSESSSPSSPPLPTRPEKNTSQADLLVFAAASTTEAINQIADAFSKANGVKVHVNCAGSAQLAYQIVRGADAHVYLSANPDWVDFLRGRGLVARQRALLGNRLVLIVPSDSELNISKPEDLTQLLVRHVAMANPDGVPAGIYARQALEKLGLWTRLRSKAATADDVRVALSYVATGSAQAGIVYATDAAASKAVRKVYEFPEDLSDPIVYHVALLKAAQENKMAVAFYDYLSSPQASQAFEKAGFRVLASSPSPVRSSPPEQ